jgi:hypothetical protein
MPSMDRPYRHRTGEFNEGGSMSLKNYLALMARYNRWMNAKVYGASSRLTASELHADKGAFFGSMFGTLNPPMVGDTIGLKRFNSYRSLLRSTLRADIGCESPARCAVDGFMPIATTAGNGHRLDRHVRRTPH